MKYEFRITKYNPSLRNESGHYLIDEWTEFTDIGKSFNGAILTHNEYRKIEVKYINAAIMMLAEAGIEDMMIESLENHQGNKDIQNNQLVAIGQIPVVIKSILRNKYWCKLRAPRRAFLHFGWDYYMYVGVSRPLNESPLKITNTGLFIEKYNSPYT